MERMLRYRDLFITPEKFETTKKKTLDGPNGWLLFVACNSGIELAKSVKSEYERMLSHNKSTLEDIPLLGTEDSPVTTVFPDTETCARLDKNVSGANAFVFQSVHEVVSGNTVNENIYQMLQVVRALKAHRTKFITVVTPYIPYSRQDKPTFMKREATLAGLFADQLKTAGADMLLTYHPHTLSLYGLYEPEISLVALSGLDLFIEMFSKFNKDKEVIAVSTDAGGAKFVVHYSNAMSIPYAISNKFRKTKDKTNLIGIIGDIKDKKSAIIIDDETVTGGSILDTVESLYKNYGVQDIYAAISHVKMKKQYLPRLVKAHEKYGLKEFHVTDTVPQIPELLGLDFVSIHNLSSRFAATINRLHYNNSVRELFYLP